MRSPTPALLLFTVAAFACNETTPKAQVALSVASDEVFVLSGAAVPLANAGDVRSDEPLVASDLVPLGSKELDAYWLPTQTEEQTPTVDRNTKLSAAMPAVNAGLWRSASGEVKVTGAGDGYKVAITAEHLIPRAVYSAWMIYANGSDAYATAPVGGLPNLLLTDDGGSASLVRLVSGRALRSGSLLAGAVANVAAASDQGPLRIADGTTITFALYYHSRGQSNANGGGGGRAIPAGRVAIIGDRGRDVHRQLFGSIPALP